MSWRSACSRRSVEVSTRIERTAAASGAAGPFAPTSIRMDGRVRRSRGSDDRQTAQSQPIAGTPCDVPLPRTVMRSEDAGPRAEATRQLRFDDAFARARGFDKPHAQLV